MLTVCTQPLSTTPQSWGCRETTEKKIKHQKLNVMFIVRFNRVCGELLLKL